MTDLDALLAPSQWEANRCHVAQVLDRIPDGAQRAKVAAAARDRMVPLDGLMQAFTHLAGITPRDNPIRRHRLGRCSCE